MMREELFGLFRRLYRSVSAPIHTLKDSFYSSKRGNAINRRYLSSKMRSNLENEIDRYYYQRTIDSFSDAIKSRFHVCVLSPEHIYLSRKG